MNDKNEIKTMLENILFMLEMEEEEEEEETEVEEETGLGLVIGFGAPNTEPKEICIDSWEEFDDLHAAIHAIERYRG